MDTSRIVINTIDNSTSYVEQSTGVVGFTVVKAPKGSITPRKILAGGASKIKDIFGEATEEYPELFEVETFNKEYDIYVSAPYSSAKVPVAYLTDKGVFIKKVLITIIFRRLFSIELCTLLIFFLILIQIEYNYKFDEKK